jgi:4-amino-4-deoxy-L-arabinose transferase
MTGKKSRTRPRYATPHVDDMGGHMEESRGWTTKKRIAALAGLYVLLYISLLGVRPVIIPDEARYAEIPREMRASGDWIVPRLDGIRYFEKPVLGYWLNAGAIALLGENAFAMRLPSALAVGISAILMFLLVRRHGGGSRVGTMTVIAFITSLEVYAVGVYNVLDSPFSMFVTAAMVSFFFAHMETKPTRKYAFLSLFGVCCGLAFLTKGFLGFVLPAVAIIPFLLWERRWKDLIVSLWVPLAVAIVTVLPWGALIHMREPDFWHYFFWVEHIQRFGASTMQHPESFWFFVPVMFGGALPWSALLPVAILGLRKIRVTDPFVRFALCWFFFPFLLLSASHGKLGTYILPCFPPFVVLEVMGIMKYLERDKKRVLTISVLVFALVIDALAVALVLSQTRGFAGVRFYGPGENWKWLLVTSAFLVWAVIALVACAGSRKRLVLFSLGPVLLMVLGHFVMPDEVKERKAPGAFLLQYSGRVETAKTLVADEELLRAVCWFYKRNDVFLLAGAGELEYGLGYRASAYRLLNVDQLKLLIDNSGSNGSVILLADVRRYEGFYRRRLPKPRFKEANAHWVIAQF